MSVCVFGKKKTKTHHDNEENFYTPFKILKLTTIAIIFIGALLIFISYVNKIKNQLYTQIDAVGNENKNTSSALVPVEQQMYDELIYIYENTTSHPENDNFKSALNDLKRLSSSIEDTIQNAGSQIQTYISLANPFNHVIANLLIPDNNQLVIKKLLGDRSNQIISSNKEIVKIRMNEMAGEITKEIQEIQKTINELNDPNLIKRANHYIQNVLVYFVSPHAVLTTGKIKLDKITNILSKIEYIKNDFNVGVKQLLAEVKITADEYSNNLHNNIVVLYWLFATLSSFGALFIYEINIYEIKKPSEKLTTSVEDITVSS